MAEEIAEMTAEAPIVIEAKEAVKSYIADNTEVEPVYDLHVLWVVEVEEYWKVYLYASFDENIRYLVTHDNVDDSIEIQVIDDGPTAEKEL